MGFIIPKFLLGRKTRDNKSYSWRSNSYLSADIKVDTIELKECSSSTHSDLINDSIGNGVCANNDMDSLGDWLYIDRVSVLQSPSTNGRTMPIESAPDLAKKPIMSAGPFGGRTSSPWDDGVRHSGVKSIKLSIGWVIDSITIEYIDEKGNTFEIKHGGTDGGNDHKVEFDYPNEYILSIWGYYGKTADDDEVNLRSLTFQSNVRTYGPFGPEDGRFFTLPATGGKVVGFHGRCDHFLKAIGAYMELP